MYAGFYLDAEDALRDVYLYRYLEVIGWLGRKKPDEDELDEMLDMWLAGFLKKPNETTHYVYETELVRKRDRAKEEIGSVPTKVQKQVSLEKAGRYVIQQNGFYVDMASQEAEWQAMKDAGIKKVRWNAYGDDRVCQTCSDLDGQVFPVDGVPDRPHLRCRCYLTPA